MGWHIAPNAETSSAREDRSSPAQEHVHGDVLAPIVSGAYARGMSDMLERAGVAAVFLDGGGCVLSLNAPCRERLGKGLNLRAGHLVADAGLDNRALAGLIARSIGVAVDGPSESTAVLSGAALTIRAVSVPGQLGRADRLLRTILLIDGHDDPILSALIERMAAPQSVSARSRANA